MSLGVRNQKLAINPRCFVCKVLIDWNDHYLLLDRKTHRQVDVSYNCFMNRPTDASG